MTLFAAIATLERKIMLERQKEGIALAKARGVYRGRKQKPKPSNWPELVERYQRRDIRSVSELARICGCSRNTIYTWLRSSGVIIKPR